MKGFKLPLSPQIRGPQRVYIICRQKGKGQGCQGPIMFYTERREGAVVTLLLTTTTGIQLKNELQH